MNSLLIRLPRARPLVSLEESVKSTRHEKFTKYQCVSHAKRLCYVTHSGRSNGLSRNTCSQRLRSNTNLNCQFRELQTNTQNHYDVLGITPKASPAQIKAAYYRLSKVYHPDVNKADDAKVKFGLIAEAYEILGNKRNKRQYDAQMMRRTSYSPTGTADFEEPFARKPPAKHSRAPPRGRSDIYNYDEFYQQHYGDFIKKNRESKEQNEALRRRFENDHARMKAKEKWYGAMMAFLLLTVTYIKLTKINMK